MLAYLKSKLYAWVAPSLFREIGLLSEALDESEQENDALRFALGSNHSRHVETTNTLLDIIGAFVLRDGGEEGRVVLSGELRAAAASSMTVQFKEEEDGDVVIHIPADEPAHDMENDLG